MLLIIARQDKANNKYMKEQYNPREARTYLQDLDVNKIHYDYMQPWYESKVRVFYMDTDSFVYEIETEDFYRHITKNVEAKV